MVARRSLTTLVTIALIPILAADCGPGGGGGGSGSGGSSSSGSGGGQLRLYSTCPPPVACDPAPMPVCTTEKEGDPCTDADIKCGVKDGCGATLVCREQDPKSGGCPISLARYKHDIRYLPESDLKRVHDELVATPLATWRYNHEGAAGREHLGFIIDDNPESPAVAKSGQHVDLYGYTSMVVAAVQVQERRIDALQQEIKALREELSAARHASGHRRAPLRAGHH
jgi:hypothetical protein